MSTIYNSKESKNYKEENDNNAEKLLQWMPAPVPVVKIFYTAEITDLCVSKHGITMDVRWIIAKFLRPYLFKRSIYSLLKMMAGFGNVTYSS